MLLNAVLFCAAFGPFPVVLQNTQGKTFLPMKKPLLGGPVQVAFGRLCCNMLLCSSGSIGACISCRCLQMPGLGCMVSQVSNRYHVSQLWRDGTFCLQKGAPILQTYSPQNASLFSFQYMKHYHVISKKLLAAKHLSVDWLRSTPHGPFLMGAGRPSLSLEPCRVISFFKPQVERPCTCFPISNKNVSTAFTNTPPGIAKYDFNPPIHYFIQ